MVIPIATISACLYVVSIRGESATDRARQICERCGLEHDEIDTLIQNVRESGLPRDQALEMYRQTFADSDQVGCEDCAEAVCDAAEVR